MSNNLITLYDIPCKGERVAGWSINVWKTRMVLNYKQIPYKTKFLDHRYLGSTLKSRGFVANAPGPHSEFTAPAIECPSDGSKTMDSAIIAPKLEAMYPEPSLHLDSGMQDKATAAVGKVGFALFAVLMPRIASDMLVDDSVDFWKAKMEPKFGMSVEEFGRVRGGEPAWERAQPGLDELKALLSENKRDAGPYILVSQVCYGDFVVVAMLEAFRRIGDDLFERVAARDPSLKRLHEACKLWLEKDD
ncbi:Hypothetical protein R9X50_00440600 [Acrodontium crateriforme]|uniref:GST N-terminal domain-containing protein n=1 Tax=Acrodontium crateriforme TaxID=150365 RepID=A0AAQ3R8D3_9PEZI|nr:Hypothetical protein R9X50_00440600 [Acrodontium crateriforme]